MVLLVMLFVAAIVVVSILTCVLPPNTSTSIRSPTEAPRLRRQCPGTVSLGSSCPLHEGGH